MEQGSSAPWLSFQNWLAQHRGISCQERAPEFASDSDSAFGDTVALSELPAAATPAPSLPLNRLPEMTARSLVPDCRLETRLVNEYTCARQQMTVMLAAPGMPLHKAPIVTAKQASSLVSAIAEPLVTIDVGKMTRQLADPVKLRHVEGCEGQLRLWLLPNDDLSLMWHHTAPGPRVSTSAIIEPALDEDVDDDREGGLLADVREASCQLSFWEEIARFPAGAHLVSDEPLMTIHMLRGDSSGRAFYLRVREDIAVTHMAAVTGRHPEAAAALGLAESRSAANNHPSSSSSSSSSQQQPISGRMYFWVTDPDLDAGIVSLGRLKSLLKRPPTLAKRTGIPEAQLEKIGEWLARADTGDAISRENDADGSFISQGSDEHDVCLSDQPASEHHVAEATTTLGGNNGTSSALQAPFGLPDHVGLRANALPHPLLMARNVSGVEQPSENDAAGGEEHQNASCSSSSSSSSSRALRATGSVSATAAAVYQDRRFTITCPCTISVVVTLGLEADLRDRSNLEGSQSRIADARSALGTLLNQKARRLAEVEARRCVDEAGRARVEERLAELLLRSVRVQRAGLRAARLEARALEARLVAAARVLPLIKRAAADADRHNGHDQRETVRHGFDGEASLLPSQVDLSGHVYPAGGSSMSSAFSPPPLRATAAPHHVPARPTTLRSSYLAGGDHVVSRRQGTSMPTNGAFAENKATNTTTGNPSEESACGKRVSLADLSLLLQSVPSSRSSAGHHHPLAEGASSSSDQTNSTEDHGSSSLRRPSSEARLTFGDLLEVVRAAEGPRPSPDEASSTPSSSSTKPRTGSEPTALPPANLP